MNGNREVAREFWRSSTSYPEYGTIKERRWYELAYLLPKLKGETLLDIGAGDCALSNCLQELTHFKKIYAYDLSENLLRHGHPDLIKKVYDIYNFEELPEADITLHAGVLSYIFEDENVVRHLQLIKTKHLYLRTPCSIQKESQLINTFSDKLGKQYASYYRTVPEVLKLLKQSGFDCKKAERIYPDEIESEYGTTKQYYFICQ